MGRKEAPKGIHTSADNYGEDNMDKVEKNTYIDDALEHLVEISRLGAKNTNKEYKGLWTEETFELAINEYFDYIVDKKIKPTKASLRLWLGCSRQQYYDWETKPEKYSYKSYLIGRANSVMESSYAGRVEKYPTGNIFLLKTTAGYIETSKVDVTSDGKALNSSEDVKDAVSKLGLDK